MSVTILYRANEVGPVCQRVVKAGQAVSKNNLKVVRDGQAGHGEVVVRWGSVQPTFVAGKTINSAEAVVLARNKKQSRIKLAELSPKTWFRYEDLQFPCVIRPKKHHAAKKFFVAKTPLEAKVAIRKCGLGWYGSELIKKSKEFRVFVLQGRVLAVSERFPAQPGQVAWNLAVGGRLVNVKYTEWNPVVLKGAIEATKRLGLDWAAIDICLDQAGKPYVFEANTAPGLRNKYTLDRIARGLSYVEGHEDPKPVTSYAWNKVLHPALKKANL